MEPASKIIVTVVGSCDGTCTVKDSTTAEATCRLTYGTVTHLCSCPPGFHLTEANPDECVGMCVALKCHCYTDKCSECQQYFLFALRCPN